MANELTILIGHRYSLNGNIYRLVDINGPYFVLTPLKVDGLYVTEEDGSMVMKAIEFSKAEIMLIIEQ